MPVIDSASPAGSARPDIFVRMARAGRGLVTAAPEPSAVVVPSQPAHAAPVPPTGATTAVLLGRLTGLQPKPRTAGTPPLATPAAVAARPASVASSLFARMSAFAPSQEELPPPGIGAEVAVDDGPTSGASAPAQATTLRGLVERAQVYNDTWGVAHIWTEDRTSVRVTGEVVGGLKDGLTYEFIGNFRTNQHGESFVATAARVNIECDRRAIGRFIARSFNGVGERTADRFLSLQVQVGQAAGRSEDEVLEEIRSRLVSAPWTLDLSSVTKKGQYEGEQNELMAEAVKRDLATRIGQVEGVKEPVLKALATWLLAAQARLSGADARSRRGLSHDLVSKCWAILATNPYRPIREIPGYGFKTADAIGRSLNIPRDDPKRLAALAAYAVGGTCSSEGHMFLYQAQVEAAIRRVDPSAGIAATVEAGLAAGRIRRVAATLADGSKAEVVYDDELYDVDNQLGRRLADLVRHRCKALSKEPEEQLRVKLQATAKRLNPSLSGGLDPSQLSALVGILTSRSRLHTITAGPGCGKTSLMEVLTAYLGAERFDYCAPTGRAALVLGKRLSAVGGNASTIHSLFRGNGREFAVNEDSPLETEILVVDEGSMPPATLWEAMIAGLAEGQHVIVLGDVGQLPSIEPGRVLDDLLKLPQVDKHRLTSSHRAAGGLLEILAQIDKGELDCKDREDVKFSHTLPPAHVGFEGVAREYIDAVGEHGFPQVALLMSRRKGEAAKADWNVTYANARLRELCNPNAPKVPGTRFHINDRVIFRDNLKVPRGSADPDAEESKEAGAAADRVTVVNGDTGTITSFTKGKGNLGGAKWIRVTLDDGRDVHYPADAQIDHSYAITVHSAQGGEYRRVIAVVTPGRESFVNREMLRTQFSRARQLMTVHADDAVLRRVAATPGPRRNSRLVEIVQRFVEQPEADEDAMSEETTYSQRCSA